MWSVCCSFSCVQEVGLVAGKFTYNMHLQFCRFLWHACGSGLLPGWRIHRTHLLFLLLSMRLTCELYVSTDMYILFRKQQMDLKFRLLLLKYCLLLWGICAGLLQQLIWRCLLWVSRFSNAVILLTGLIWWRCVLSIRTHSWRSMGWSWASCLDL